MLTAAVRDPLAVGLKVTVIVQLAPPAMLVPQLLICEKSLALLPVRLIPVKFNGVLPTFVKAMSLGSLVMPIGWFPKDNFVGESLTTVPGPVKAIACGLAGSETSLKNIPALNQKARGVVQIDRGCR